MMVSESGPKRKIDEQFAFKVITNETLGAIFIVIIIAIVMIASTDSFLTMRNITNVLRVASFYVIVAMGAMLTIIVGQLDLSVGSTMGLAGIVASILAKDGVHPLVIFVACTAIGVGIGSINGLLVGYMRLPAFIVTLGMLLSIRGFATLTTMGNPVNGLSAAFNSVGTSTFLNVPTPIYIMAIIAFMNWFLLNRTLFGRHVYAVGSNVQGAIVSGISAKRVTLYAYILSGALAAFSGILLTSRMMSGQVTLGEGYELMVIAGIVIGGASIMGGSGTTIGTVFGMLVICLVNNAMTLVSMNPYFQPIVQGIIIILAMILDINRQSLKNRSKFLKNA